MAGPAFSCTLSALGSFSGLADLALPLVCFCLFLGFCPLPTQGTPPLPVDLCLVISSLGTCSVTLLTRFRSLLTGPNLSYLFSLVALL